MGSQLSKLLPALLFLLNVYVDVEGKFQLFHNPIKNLNCSEVAHKLVPFWQHLSITCLSCLDECGHAPMQEGMDTAAGVIHTAGKSNRKMSIQLMHVLGCNSQQVVLILKF